MSALAYANGPQLITTDPDTSIVRRRNADATAVPLGPRLVIEIPRHDPDEAHEMAIGMVRLDRSGRGEQSEF